MSAVANLLKLFAERPSSLAARARMSVALAISGNGADKLSHAREYALELFECETRGNSTVLA